MASSQQQLNFAIRAINEASATLKKVQGDVDGLGESASKSGGMMSGFGKSLGHVASIAGGFVVAQGLIALPGLISDMSSLASQLELDVKKINTVFADQRGIVKDWADKNAAAMGITSLKAQSLAANFADLLIPMGFTRAEGAELATSVVGLSGALAEWSGGTRTAAEVSDILAKAMLGERDGLKALGISILDADVKARLAVNGTNELTGAALEQAKAIATQQLIMEKSLDAQAAYADGAGSAARQSAELNARIDTIKENLATGLQPAFLALGQIAINVVTGLGPVLTYVGSMAAVIIPVLMSIVIVIRDFIQPVIAQFMAYIQQQWALFKPYYDEYIRPVLENIRDGIAAIIQFVVDHWPEIMTVIGPVMDLVKVTVESAFTIIRGLLNVVIHLLNGDFAGAWRAIGKVVEDVFSSIEKTVKASVNVMIALINVLLDAISAIEINVPDIPLPFGKSIPGFSIGMPQIPHIPMLANGGIVTRPTLALIGEAGPEAVIPLGRGGGGGGNTYNVVVMSPDALLSTIVELERSGRLAAGVTSA